ncbi:MAG: hypothetical protein HYV35_12255 [Lentisphaerae bacterium]|nr:hypothetical protein [Lentisphaerota bacterium]
MNTVGTHRQNRFSLVVGLLLAGLAGLCSAQTQTQVQAQVQAKDFSKGFAKFYELGLPVVTNATYVKLDSWSHFDMSGGDFGLHELRLAGNAWLLKEDKAEGKGVFVKNSVRVMEVLDQNAFQKKEAAKLKEAMKKGGSAARTLPYIWGMMDEQVAQGRWKAANPKQDLEKIMAFLKKKNEEGSSRHSSLDYSGGYGTLFLSAIHFHRMGFTNEANEMVSLLFGAARDQRKPIAQAMNQLADAQYADVARKFFQTGDWSRYDQDLQSLQARFGSVWGNAPAVQRLAEKVKARASQPQPPPLSGEGLTDEDKQLALELASATNLNRQSMQLMGGVGVWILPSPLQRGIPGMPGLPTNTLTRIKARGMQAIPLLLALLKDDYLTRVDITSLKGMSHVSFSFRDEEDMTEEHINLLYEALQRPASRSEIAVLLLQPLIKKDEENRHSSSPVDRDDLAEQVKAWHAEHKAQSALELAWFYLKEGDDQQRNAAISLLIESGSESNQAAIAESFLKGDNPMRDIHLAHQFVMKRKEKAADFLVRYEAMLKKLMETGGDDQMFKQDDFKQMVEQNLASMKTLISAQPLEQILDELLTEKTTMEKAGAALYGAMGKKKPAELVPLLLGAAVKAKTPELRVQFMQMTASVPYMRTAMAMDEDGNVQEEAEEKADADQPAALDIKPAAELWKQLLGDTRVPEADLYQDNSMSVADTAAGMIEALYGEKQAAGALWGRQAPFQITRMQPILAARAEARLAGKPAAELPPLPDADSVSAEEKKKIVEQVLRAKDTEVDALIKTLSVDRVLALMEEVERNEALNAKLAGLANRVNAVAFKNLQGEPSRELDALKGQQLSKAMVEQALAVSRRFTEEGKPSLVRIRRQPDLSGIAIRVVELSATNLTEKEWPYFSGMRSSSENKKSMVQGSVSASDSHGWAAWAVNQKKLPLPEKKDATDGTNASDALTEDDIVEQVSADSAEHEAEQQKEFWKVVEDLCAGGGAVSAYTEIRFTGMPILPDDVKEGGGPIRGVRRFRHSSRSVIY